MPLPGELSYPDSANGRLRFMSLYVQNVRVIWADRRKLHLIQCEDTCPLGSFFYFLALVTCEMLRDPF